MTREFVIPAGRAATRPKAAKPKTAPARPSASSIKPPGTVKPASAAKKTTVTAKPAGRPAVSRPAAGTAAKPASVSRPGQPLTYPSATRPSGSGEYRDMLAGLIR
jgi:hypothetical protein